MGKQLLKYTFGAAALVLIVTHASAAGKLIVDGANGYAADEKALQGR